MSDSPDSVPATRARRERLLLYGCAALIVVAVLAPLVSAGYVLRYDMVFVPRQPLRWDLLVPAGTPPRAVPLDALVSLTALVAPGWLVQRIALGAILAAAAIGAGRLVPARRTATRVVAAIAYAWTPFLAERLLLGQWGLLLCYAALPWLVGAARDVRLGRPMAGARLILAAACASVTPTGGVIAFATTCLLARRVTPGSHQLGVHPSDAPQSKRAPHERGLLAAAKPHSEWDGQALREQRPGLQATGEPRFGWAGFRVWGGRLSVSVHSKWAGGALRGFRLPVAVAALNAPWLLIAVGSAAPVVSDPAGVGAFAARAENWGGTLAALAGTGGIWNAFAVPASRSTPFAPLWTLAIVAAAVFGFGWLRRRWADGTATRLALLGGGSLLLAAAGALPGTAGVLRAAVAYLPGAGLLRDGQKFLIPYALCLALCLALGAERLADLLGARVSVGAGRLVLAGFALLPIVVLPDLAWGVGGKLRPVAYPAEWATVADAVAAAPGPVVSLPMSAYRAYPWNGSTVVLDPATRYLPGPVVTDDRLRVGSTVVAGESQAAASVRARLAAGQSAAGERVRWVLVQRDAGGTVPATALAGLTPVHRGASLELYRNPGYRPLGSDRGWELAGYLLAGSVVAAAGWRRVSRRRTTVSTVEN